MRLICSLTVKDETERYLESFLDWNSQWWDILFVYDDQSTDGTVELCQQYTDHVYVRPDDVPSFMEHEGQFRTAAFAKMEEVLELTEEDWILSMDADEFLVADHGQLDIRADIEEAMDDAVANDRISVDVKIPEVWDTTGILPRIRIDGYWDTMSLPRLFKYQSEWEFRKKPMGCGSGPTYTYKKSLKGTKKIHILHVGYSDPKDRQAKYDRYTGLKNHGHNNKHIKSIISQPTLKDWEGEVPKFWRGVIRDGRLLNIDSLALRRRAAAGTLSEGF